MPGKLFILSAPSGAGKSSLVRALIKSLKVACPLKRVITYTTKQPRSGEVTGRDYHYVTEIDFQQKIKEGFFLEWSTAYGAFYGSPRSIINELAEGKSQILIIDRIGAETIARFLSDSVLIWVSVPPTTLRKRLQSRGTENESQINYRLKQGMKEIKKEQKEPLYSYHLINNDFQKTVVALEAIVRKEIS